jgi:hypothetical protein
VVGLQFLKDNALLNPIIAGIGVGVEGGWIATQMSYLNSWPIGPRSPQTMTTRGKRILVNGTEDQYQGNAIPCYGGDNSLFGAAQEFVVA